MELKDIAELPWEARMAVYAGMVVAGLLVLGVMTALARNPRVWGPTFLLLFGALALAAGLMGWTGTAPGRSQAVLWGVLGLAAGFAALWFARRRGTR